MKFNNINIAHNATEQTQTLFINNEVPIMTVGRGSYVENSSIHSELPINIKIGQFCSLNEVTFLFQVDRTIEMITTSNDERVAQLPGIFFGKYTYLTKAIDINNDVWIGENATIVGGNHR